MRFAIASASLSLLLALACAGTMGQRAQQVRDGLVGMQGRRIISCIGAPETLEQIDTATGHELWSYRIHFSLPEAPAVSGSVRDGRHDPTRPDPTTSTGIPMPPSMDAEVERDPMAEMSRAVDPAHCSFLFELEQGRVRGLRASGRTADGLTAETRCVLLLQRCIPDDSR